MNRALILILFTIICSCTTLKNVQDNEVIVARGYYFVIQLHSLSSDTIFFETIEIYSPSPILDASNLDSAISVVNAVKIPLEKFSTGYLKGVREKSIGNVMLLYTKPNWISENNFVKFDYVDHPEWTDLTKLFRLGECK